MRRISRQITVLFVGDLLIYTLVFALVFILRPETYKPEFLFASVMLGGFWMYIMYLKGFYSIMDHRVFWVDAYNIFESILIGAVVAIVFSFFNNPIFLPRINVLLTATTVYFFILAWRLSFNYYMRRYRKPKNVVIIGAGDTGATMARTIQEHSELNYNIVGYVDDDTEKMDQVIEGFPVLARCKQLPDIVKNRQINIIILAITGKPRSNETLFAVAECMKMQVKFFEMTNLYSYLTGKIPVNYITNSWFIYEMGASHRPFYETIKRLFDIAGALLVSFVTAPIMLFMAASIKMEDGGPVIYSQERVGKNNKIFKMHKFRTMVNNAEKNGAVWAADNNKDPRVTKIGKIARKLRFDELPQMYNIIKGDMSLVGPRPERPEFTSKLEKEIPFYQRRHWVTPGWTGWAQICFRYGASVDDACEKLQYDFYYIQNRSLFLDISIFIKAIAMALSGRHG